MKKLAKIFSVVLSSMFLLTSCGPSACDCAEYGLFGIEERKSMQKEAEDIKDPTEKIKFLNDKTEEIEKKKKELKPKMDECEELRDKDEDFKKEIKECGLEMLKEMKEAEKDK